MKKEDYVYEICKVGRGNKCCRYLLAGVNGFECAKINSPEFIPALNKRVKSKTITAKGNNCKGKDLINYEKD